MHGMFATLHPGGHSVRGHSAGDSIGATANKGKFLVAMTTCNQWHLTDAALTNLASLTDNIDLVIVDDNSEDGTAELARERGITVIQVYIYICARSLLLAVLSCHCLCNVYVNVLIKQDAVPHGLTHNWNVAYRLFKNSPQYSAVFFINNDIIFPNGTFTRLAEVRVSCN